MFEEGHKPLSEYENDHRNLRFKITSAILEFEAETGAKVTRVDYRPGMCDFTTTLTPPRNSTDTFTKEIQRRLDFLDDEIDMLEREKKVAGDPELDLIEEAKHVQQVAREHFSKSDYQAAWLGIFWAESCIGLGQSELNNYQRLIAEMRADMERLFRPESQA